MAKELSLDDLSGMMGNFDIIKMMELASEYGPKIKAMVPKLQEFLPKIKEWEKTHELKEGEIIMYSGIATNSNVFIYVNRAKKGENNEVILIEQLYRYDLIEMVNKIMTYIPC